jgi:hypothetical protein
MLPLDHKNSGFAYVTKNALRLVPLPKGREFVVPQDLPERVLVSNGTGIVAADVNGDHVSDLVFSESGKLRVLKAGLEQK